MSFFEFLLFDFVCSVSFPLVFDEIEVIVLHSIEVHKCLDADNLESVNGLLLVNSTSWRDRLTFIFSTFMNSLQKTEKLLIEFFKWTSPKISTMQIMIISNRIPYLLVEIYFEMHNAFWNVSISSSIAVFSEEQLHCG